MVGMNVINNFLLFPMEKDQNDIKEARIYNINILLARRNK